LRIISCDQLPQQQQINLPPGNDKNRRFNSKWQLPIIQLQLAAFSTVPLV